MDDFDCENILSRDEGAHDVNDAGDDSVNSDWRRSACPCKVAPIVYNVWTAAGLTSEATGLVALHQLERVDPSRLLKLDSYGYSALHYSAQKNHTRKVKLLLRYIKDPDLSGCGASALHRAAFAGAFECCQLLLDAGADPNKLDTSMSGHMTPIQKAKLNGHVNIVELLLKYNAEDKDLPLVDGDEVDNISRCVTSSSNDDNNCNSNANNYANNSSSNSGNNSSNSSSNNSISSKVTSKGTMCDDCGNQVFAIYRRKTDSKRVCSSCRYL